MLPSATSSSSSGARAIHQPSCCARISESSPSQSAYSATSGVATAPVAGELVGELEHVDRDVAVDVVLGRRVGLVVPGVALAHRCFTPSAFV